MGWLIALGVLILLAIMPLGVSISYDSGGALVRVILGFFRLQVFPMKKKEKKASGDVGAKKSRKEKKPAAKTPADTAADPSSGSVPREKKKQGGPVTDFLPLVRVVLDFLTDFRRKLRVNRLELNLVLAGGDPCDLATNYGKACAALGNLWPRLEEFLVIKKRDVRIQCDFEGDKTLVTARLDTTITLGRVFSVGLRYGFRAIRELLKILNKRKGGAAL